MKFKFEQDSVSTLITASPTNLDGHPLIDTLDVKWLCGEVSGDRIAAAALLAFSPYISGPQILPLEFSSLTSELVESLFEPLWIHMSPVHPANLPLPRGSRWLSLEFKEDAFDASIMQDGLLLTTNSAESGWSSAPGILRIASNAESIDIVASSAYTVKFRARLAAALLVAESLDVAGYVVSQNTANSLGLDEPVLEILNSVSLGIRVRNE